ncbi:hypothetical protein ACLOJK_007004 [Asimina triloba]
MRKKSFHYARKSPHREVFNMVSLLGGKEDTVPCPSSLRKEKRSPSFHLADRLAADTVSSHTAQRRSDVPGKGSKGNRE